MELLFACMYWYLWVIQSNLEKNFKRVEIRAHDHEPSSMQTPLVFAVCCYLPPLISLPLTAGYLPLLAPGYLPSSSCCPPNLLPSRDLGYASASFSSSAVYFSPSSSSFHLLLPHPPLPPLPLPPLQLTSFPSHSSSSLSLWYIPMYVFWYWLIRTIPARDGTIPWYKIVILDFYLFLIS